MVTKLVGTITDSTGNPVTGFLTIRLNAPLVNETPTPDETRYTKPIRYKLVNGSFANVQKEDGTAVPNGVELLPTNEPTYQFDYNYEFLTLELYLVGERWTGDFHKEGTAPVRYYTGAVNFPARQELTPFNRVTLESLFEPINSSIPDQATMEWSKLQHSSINSSNINTAAYFIAGIIANDYANKISLNIARPRGNWNVATQYQIFDVVFNPSDNATYWYINEVATTGNPVTNIIYWMRIGQASSGGGGGIEPSDVLLDLAFSQANWETESGKAPVASRLYAQMIKYAVLADSTFLSLRAPTRPLGTNTTEVATMAALQQALSAFVAPPSTTAPNLTNFDAESQNIVNQFSYKRSLNRYFRATQEASSGSGGGGGGGNRTLTHLRENSVSNPQGSQNVAELTGGFIQLRAGTYFIEGRAASRGTDGTRHDLVTSTGVTLIVGDSVHPGMTGRLITEIGNTWGGFSARLVLDSTVNVTIRSNFQTTGDSTDRGRPAGRGGNEIYAVLEGWML